MEIDRETIINGLEYCTTHYNCRNKASTCPYIDLCKPIEDATGNTLEREALALLKSDNTLIENQALLINDLGAKLREKPEMPEIIHCKDCIWWDKKDDSNYGYCHACKHGYSSPHWEIGIYRTYTGDWFCADGEAKDNA